MSAKQYKGLRVNDLTLSVTHFPIWHSSGDLPSDGVEHLQM